MLENKEIDQMMKILALDSSKQYDTPNGLRYGSVMIMTDQDHDGSHIKGLIINFLHTHFPSLIRMPGFLKERRAVLCARNRSDDMDTHDHGHA